MPPAAKGSKVQISDGERLEARIVQLWFWEGSFARRGVNMSRYFGPDPLDVTDLDLLALDFGPNLECRKTIGEAKSGKSKSTPKPLDRVIWLRGLMALTDADRAELTTALEPGLRVRELGHSHGVDAQSLADLDRRETAASIGDVADLATFGPTFVPQHRLIAAACKRDPFLERAYWYLTSEVWFSDPWAAIKRTLSLLREARSRWTPRARDDHEFAVRWLLTEGVIVFTLNMVIAAERAVRLPSEDFSQLAMARLGEGAVPMAQMRALSDSIDRYVSGLLRELQAPESVIMQTAGAFMPTPPDYAPSAVEVLRRLSSRPRFVRQLPRWMDLVCSERMLRGRDVTGDVVARLGLEDPTRTASAAKVVATFLRGQVDLPSELFQAITTPVGSYGTDAIKPENDDPSRSAVESTPTAREGGSTGEVASDPSLFDGEK